MNTELQAALLAADKAAEDLREAVFVVDSHLEETPLWLKRIRANAESAGEELRFVIDQREREAF